MRHCWLLRRLGVLIIPVSLVPWFALGSPSVNVALQASFGSPPYLLELLETAVEENSTSYFPLLDRIAEGRFADQISDEELYMTFLEVLQDDGHIVDPAALSSFQLALSMHAAVPRIQAHYQFYNTSVEPSLMIAQDAACPVWVHSEGRQYCSPALDRAQQAADGLGTFEDLPFDHTLKLAPGLSSSILYADITSPLFSEFHQTLSERARGGRISYRIRHRPSPLHLQKPLVVSGYGVELALKRTDYIVIDDREAEETEKATDTLEVTGDLSLKVDDFADLKPLSSSELSGLGLKASSFILNSEDSLSSLIKVSQDFPKHSSNIAKLNASEEFLKEHRANRDIFLPPGYNVVWMNGLQINAREMEAFALISQLRHERRLIGSLRDIGLTAPEAIALLSHSAIAESKAESEPQRYDYRDTLEGGNVVIWLNDIDNDARYEGWPSHLNMLLQRTYPGQMPTVRRDLHNLVMPLDLADSKDVEVLLRSLLSFVMRKIPIRFGIVPVLSSQQSTEQAKAIYYLYETYGLDPMISYLEASSQSKVFTAPHKTSFESIVRDKDLQVDKPTKDFQAVFNAAEYQIQVGRTESYLHRLGIDGSTLLFINGVAIARNDKWLQEMSSRVELDLRVIQRQVFEETVNEDTWLAGQFLESAASNRNPLVIPEDESSIKVLDVGKLVMQNKHIYHGLPRLAPSSDALKQFWAHVVIVADFDSDEGSRLLLEAVDFSRTQNEIEVVMLHNPSMSSHSNPRSTLVFELLLKGLELDRDELDVLLRSTINDQSPINEMAEAFWLAMQNFVESMGFESGEQGVMLNGRLVGPIPRSAVFTSEDFRLLHDFERLRRITPANIAVTSLNLEERIDSPLASAILSSLIAVSSESDIPEGIFDSAPPLRMNMFEKWEANHSAISVGDQTSSSIRLVVSLDPTSEIAQRWVPMLKVLSGLTGVYLRIFLNPRERMQELPVKRFYRYVLDAKPSFNDDGTLRDRGANFEGLPKEALLNLGLDVPPAWLVGPKESIHDLDNIKLSALKDSSNIDAIYELEHILIEGHSRDVDLGSPPRGVQLLLGTEKDPHFADTLIMANLGYFQFKANPGYWKIQLQDGRSSQIFNLDSVGAQGYSVQLGDQTTDVALTSFQGNTLFPRLSRRAGQEGADVLEEAQKPMVYISKTSKFAQSVLSSVGLSSKSQHADINIFSVASGHLYERMLNIMMVSVMRHTQHTVKFWFIEQFLSPSFKSFLPHLAAVYNFEYEMVTYKWPHWLRSQKEKQREIWGYKILFLDVLFPLSLDKVIFVDADQIVRTDMYDLVKHDLEGAVYGFTPMCDSRTEMEGFRFWKQGYWKNFLRGLPYHISALYVVDLKRFRQMAAGDRLRGQYHQLSADPASLSNLDQDLPNHMQMVLPIHSLPQEWLWCETWCSDESLEKARTIDLCNNPQTKEPKLDRARRQVPEWTVYDEEIADVSRKVRKVNEPVQVENGHRNGKGEAGDNLKIEL